MVADSARRSLTITSGHACTGTFETFQLDEIQADAILDAQLYKIAQMEIQKILQELREKKKEAERALAWAAGQVPT
jgi:DNA gyrase/topoisomerase IV subunit A